MSKTKEDSILMDAIKDLKEVSVQFETAVNRFIHLTGTEMDIWQKSLSDTLTVVERSVRDENTIEIIRSAFTLLKQGQRIREEMGETLESIGNHISRFGNAQKAIAGLLLEYMDGEKKETL